MSDRDHRVRDRAYHLWERAGRPHHRDHEFWHQADAEIAAEDAREGHTPAPATTAKAVPEPPAERPKRPTKAAAKAKDKTLPAAAVTPEKLAAVKSGKPEKPAAKKPKKKA